MDIDSIEEWLDSLPFYFYTSNLIGPSEDDIYIKIIPKKGYRLLEDINFPDDKKLPDWHLVNRGKLLLLKKNDSKDCSQ